MGMDTHRLNSWAPVILPKCSETGHVSQSSWLFLFAAASHGQICPTKFAHFEEFPNTDQKLSCRLAGSRSETFWVWQMTKIAPQTKETQGQSNSIMPRYFTRILWSTNKIYTFQSHWHVMSDSNLFNALLCLHVFFDQYSYSTRTPSMIFKEHPSMSQCKSICACVWVCVCVCVCVCCGRLRSLVPVVPHRAVAEVSKIGNLQDRFVAVMHGCQSEQPSEVRAEYFECAIKSHHSIYIYIIYIYINKTGHV